MKTTPLHFLTVALGIFLAINACTKRPEVINPSTSVADSSSDNSLNTFFAGKRSKIQKFTFNADESNTFYGTKGTRVQIGAGTLRTMSGLPVTGTVTLELKEVTELSEMILNNAPTVSNGQILTSGGEVYVSVSQNGEPLKLDNNAGFFVTIAAPRGTTDSMTVFTGRDSLGTIVWTTAQADTVNSNVIVPADSSQDSRDTSAYYQSVGWAIVNRVNAYVVRCTKFGWINCDYFASYPNVCRLTTKCDTIYKTINTKVFFVIPATNSAGNFYVDSNFDFFCSTLPNHTNLTLVAINYHDKKYYVAIKKHKINCDGGSNISELDFIEIPESQIESYLSQINI
jgi:hypothetical protein